MRFKEGENGSGKSRTAREPVGADWVIYNAGSPAPEPEDLPAAIISHIQKDLAEHPSLRAKAIVPLTPDGDTVAFAMWFEEVA